MKRLTSLLLALIVLLALGSAFARVEPVASVTLDAVTLSLNPGQTHQLVADVLPSNATNAELEWTTTDAAVAIVSATGLVTAAKAGTATIKAEALDGFGAKATCVVTVMADLSAFPHDAIPPQMYTGAAITPAVTVFDGTTALLQGTDFTAAYDSNVYAGTAQVTITGAGFYFGSKSLSFIIAKAPGAITDISDVSKDYDGLPVSAPAFLKTGNGAVTIAYFSGTLAGGDLGTAPLPAAPSAPGWYSTKLTLAEGLNHLGAEELVAFEIRKAVYDMTGAGWNYTAPYLFDGKVKTVTVTGLPAGVAAASYEGNTGTAVGTYQATVMLSYDAANFQAPALSPLTWKINVPVPSTLRPSVKVTKIEAMSGTSLKLTWSRVAGASGYEIWRSTVQAGPYKLVRKTTATTFTNTYLTPGTRYFYKLRTFDTVAGSDFVSGKYSAAYAGIPIAKTTITKAVGLSTSRIQLAWSTAAGATGYKISISTRAAGPYSVIKSISGTTITLTGLQPGRTLYFKVTPFKRVSTSSYYGPVSGYKAATTMK